MIHTLSTKYLSVARGDYHSYGGSQLWMDSRTLREVGCGVIAAADLLIHLCQKTPKPSAQAFLALPAERSPIPFTSYRDLVKRLRTHYFPLFPHLGINGLFLAAGMNLIFWHTDLPFRARWGVPYRQLWTRMEEMLDQDIPVILSVGPNFPLFWQKHTLPFYLRDHNDSYRPGAETRAHYVTVTGMDEHWLQISSWGKKYYISRPEYLSYVRKYSARLTSNILYIRKNDHGAV